MTTLARLVSAVNTKIARAIAAGMNVPASNPSLAALWFVIAAVNLVFAIALRPKPTQATRH
jgi:hypothetical protein